MTLFKVDRYKSQQNRWRCITIIATSFICFSAETRVIFPWRLVFGGTSPLANGRETLTHLGLNILCIFGPPNAKRSLTTWPIQKTGRAKFQTRWSTKAGHANN